MRSGRLNDPAAAARLLPVVLFCAGLILAVSAAMGQSRMARARRSYRVVCAPHASIPPM